MPSTTPSAPENADQAGVIVYVDGQRITLTREQEALIRAWASGPI